MRAHFVWCVLKTFLKHIGGVLLDAELREFASENLKNGTTNWLGPPSDYLSERVVAEGVTRDLLCILSHLFHDVLLVLEFSRACNDYLNDADPVFIYTEVADLTLDFLKNKVKNSFESFRRPFWSLN